MNWQKIKYVLIVIGVILAFVPIVVLLVFMRMNKKTIKVGDQTADVKFKVEEIKSDSAVDDLNVLNDAIGLAGDILKKAKEKK